MAIQEETQFIDERVSSETLSIVLAEYNNLRAEILKRIELRHQLISLALVAPGTIIAVGFTSHNAFLVLSYPILVCFLSGVWVANTQGVREISHYIKTSVEPKLGKNNVGWEHYHLIASRPFRLVGILGSGFIFILTQLLCIFAGITLVTFTITEKILLFFAILSVIASIIMLVQLERKRKIGES